MYIQIKKKKIIKHTCHCDWLDLYHISLATTCLVLRDQVPSCYVTVKKKKNRKTGLRMKSSMTELSEFFMFSCLCVRAQVYSWCLYTQGVMHGLQCFGLNRYQMKSGPVTLNSRHPTAPLFFPPLCIYGLKLRYVECIYYGSKVGDCS